MTFQNAQYVILPWRWIGSNVLPVPSLTSVVDVIGK